jgi:hypothetical protein
VANGITATDITNWNSIAASQWTTNGSNIHYSTGNVGVGVAAPAARLEVAGTGATNATTSLMVRNSGGTANMAVLDNGYVGIGTASPINLLHVEGTNSGNILTLARFKNLGTAMNTESRILLSTQNDTGNPISSSINNITTNPSSGGTSDMTFYTTSNGSYLERMRITGAGKIGIGTSSPTNDLDIIKSINGPVQLYVGNPMTTGSRSASVLAGTQNGGTIRLVTNATGSSLYGIPNGYGGITTEWGDMSFATGSSGTATEKMRLTTGGALVLTKGNVSPGAVIKLSNGDDYDQFGITDTWDAYWTSNAYYTGTQWNYVNVGGYGGVATRLTNGGGVYNFCTASNAANPVAWNSRLYILNDGRIGIGTTSPSYTLHVNGSVAGTSAYNNLSDKRFKKDVLPIANALQKVLALQGITFNWDKNINPELKVDDKNHIGFLAQDVEKVLPQVVSTADDKLQTKSVAYTEVIPVLVEAIKQQQTQIEELKKMIEVFTNKERSSVNN